MHFVDDVDFVAANGRAELDAFDDFTRVVDAGVRCSVHLDDVDSTAFCNGGTHATGSTGTLCGLGQTVDCFGEQTRDSGFANASRTGEYIGMANPSVDDCVAQCPDDVFLTDEFVECL
jgi:hypothetical protein